MRTGLVGLSRLEPKDYTARPRDGNPVKRSPGHVGVGGLAAVAGPPSPPDYVFAQVSGRNIIGFGATA